MSDRRVIGVSSASTLFSISLVYRAIVFDQNEFLAEALAKAGGVQANIGRMLGLPSSRTTDLFKGRRKLKLDEAVKLSDAYGVPITAAAASADALEQVLAVALKSSPGGWTDQDIRKLAAEVAFGLRYRASAADP